MIKLNQVCELMNGSFFHRTVYVNPSYIQYYHADILQIPCESDIPVTRIVTLSHEDLLVTETPDYVDLFVSSAKI